MLPKSRRIPRKLFGEILKEKKYFNSEHFSLRVALSPDKTARIAVSVSKKISKKAVARNRIRRRVYSTLIPMTPSLNPNLYLIIAKSGAQNLKGEKLKIELQKLLG